MKQEEWDRLLVESFYLRPDYTLRRISGFDVPEESGILELKRTPYDKYGIHMSVCAFICGHLPKLADILWRRSKDDIDVISRVLTKSNIDCLKKSVYLGYRLRDANQASKDVMLHSKRMKLISDLSVVNDKSHGHNWSVIK